MTIPVGYAHVVHTFGGTGYPLGAAITYGTEVGGSPPVIANYAQDLHDALSTNWSSFWSLDTSLVSTLVKYGPDATGASALATGTISGSGSGDTASPNSALLIRKVTLLGGRRGRGRLYMVGLADSSILDGGDIGAGALTAGQAAADAWLADIEALATPMVLLHEGTTTPTVVQSLVVQGRAATQRRRLRR